MVHVFWSHRLLVHSSQLCVLVNALLDLLFINLQTRLLDQHFAFQLFSELKEDLIWHEKPWYTQLKWALPSV